MHPAWANPAYHIVVVHDTLAVMQALRGKMVDSGAAAAADGAAFSTWAHARAALVLRTEAVSIALRWVAGAKTIQARTHVT